MEVKAIIFISFITTCWARASFPDLTDDNFQNDCLASHNSKRPIHHSPNVVINATLVQYAKARCQTVSKYEGLNEGHAGLATGIGENLYWSGSSANVTASASEAITYWYNEVSNYNYNSPGFSTGVTGHFTQLVWKATTGIGCARCGGKGSQWYETYVVTNYYPQGNIVSNNYQYYKTNVLRP